MAESLLPDLEVDVIYLDIDEVPEAKDIKTSLNINEEEQKTFFDVAKKPVDKKRKYIEEILNNIESE